MSLYFLAQQNPQAWFTKLFIGTGLTPTLLLTIVLVSVAIFALFRLFNQNERLAGVSEAEIKRILNRELAPLLNHRGMARQEVTKLIDERHQVEQLSRQALEQKIAQIATQLSLLANQNTAEPANHTLYPELVALKKQLDILEEHYRDLSRSSTQAEPAEVFSENQALSQLQQEVQQLRKDAGVTAQTLSQMQTKYQGHLSHLAGLVQTSESQIEQGQASQGEALAKLQAVQAELETNAARLQAFEQALCTLQLAESGWSTALYELKTELRSEQSSLRQELTEQLQRLPAKGSSQDLSEVRRALQEQIDCLQDQASDWVTTQAFLSLEAQLQRELQRIRQNATLGFPSLVNAEALERILSQLLANQQQLINRVAQLEAQLNLSEPSNAPLVQDDLSALLNSPANSVLEADPLDLCSSFEPTP